MTTIERIKKISKEHGWSLQKVAEKAGIGINSIYRWNTKTPSTASLQAVADVLGVSVDYLLGKEEEATNKDYDGEVEEALNSARMYQGKPISDAQRETIKGIVKAYLDAQDKDK